MEIHPSSANGPRPARDAGFSPLAEDLAAAFEEGVAAPWADERFNELALRVFRWQLETNPVYQRFAEGREATARSITAWQDIPAVPVRAFKRLPLISGNADAVERVFRTSGTTEGRRRGEHHVPRLDLYFASLRPSFRAHLLPDGAALRFLSLIPSPAVQPDSSLSTMVGEVARAYGAQGSAWFAEGGAVDMDGLTEAVRSAEREGEPVLVLGTAFAFVHWLDALEAMGARAPRFRLPVGSRLLETGGFKGRTLTVARDVLYRALSERLGLGVEWMVNEYGMTELLSQYYEGSLGRPAASPVAAALEARRLVPPPWLRFQVLDSATLRPLPDGEPGVLAHFDLANAGSILAVLTEDVGFRDAGGLKLLGRSLGSEPRGCSVAMDELLAAAEVV